MTLKPQARQTLDLLRSRGADGATPAEARNAIACDRLAARVFELRAAGYVIDSVPERTPMGARIARYYLRDRPRFAAESGVQEALPMTPTAHFPATPSGAPTALPPASARRWRPHGRPQLGQG